MKLLIRLIIALMSTQQVFAVADSNQGGGDPQAFIGDSDDSVTQGRRQPLCYECRSGHTNKKLKSFTMRELGLPDNNTLSSPPVDHTDSESTR